VARAGARQLQGGRLKVMGGNRVQGWVQGGKGDSASGRGAGQGSVTGRSKAHQRLVKGTSKVGQRHIKGWSKVSQRLVTPIEVP
jgi:hypothetical protein